MVTVSRSEEKGDCGFSRGGSSVRGCSGLRLHQCGLRGTALGWFWACDGAVWLEGSSGCQCELGDVGFWGGNLGWSEGRLGYPADSVRRLGMRV